MLSTSRVVALFFAATFGALAAAVPLDHKFSGIPTTCTLDISSPAYCTGTKPSIDAGGRWLCDDERLGPKDLNLPAPFDALVLGYDRLGGLCPEAFFQKWFEPSGRPKWPQYDGFAVRGGAPQKSIITLSKGLRIDRFGAENGTFVAPAGTPYALRALTPSNLVVKDQQQATIRPFNYYEYEVLEDIDEVLAGPVQPWFGQTGWGTQYKLPKPVYLLMNEGALRRVEMVEAPPSSVEHVD